MNIVEAFRYRLMNNQTVFRAGADLHRLLDYADAVTAERDEARAEVERLKNALQRFANIDMTGPVFDSIAWDILNARAVLRGAPPQDDMD